MTFEVMGERVSVERFDAKMLPRPDDSPQCG